MKITKQSIIFTLSEMSGSVSSHYCLHDRLEDVLSALGIEHPEVLAEWNNERIIDVNKILLLSKVVVEKLHCDNCGSIEYRCHPPDDDWSEFQGCQYPYNVGIKYERRKGDLFACSDCVKKNPILSEL